ncbi:MAG TPA: TolC family protein [Dehalococcoidia bacterium]|nr:TolC family protein [Dehalococcoidia bacterium]
MKTAQLRRIATAGACVTLLMSSACTTLGPDYEEPEVAWLNDWQSDLYGQIGAPEKQAEVDLSFWWRLFDDPVLNDLIETARRENPTLRIAGLRILESRAVLGIASSNRYPQLQQLSGAATRADRELKGGQAADRNQSYTAYQASFDVGWELDFWGRFRRGIESAEAGFFASITNQRDVQVLLSAQVADLYFAYRTTLLRIAIARENVVIQKRSLEITERIFEAGEGAELDVQQAKTQYLATLSTIPDLEATLIQIRNALGAVLGRAPGDVPELASVSGQLPTIEQVVIQGLPARLLLRRPDLRTAAWQIAAQSAQIGIAEADYYPAITLLGSIGWSSDTLGPNPDIHSVAGGPALTWNVFDYGRIRNNVRLQDARLQLSIEAFQDSVLQAAREIDDAAIRVIKTGEQQGILSDALRAAERSLELANTLYQEGFADFQRVLDAQQALFVQAERQLVNQGDHVRAVVELYRAIGGGWLDMPVEQLVPESVRETMRTRTKWGDLLTAPLPVPPGAEGP